MPIKICKNLHRPKNLHEYIRGVRDKYQVWLCLWLCFKFCPFEAPISHSHPCPILPPFPPHGIGYDLHPIIHSRRVNKRKYFQINCSLEALISSYFHRFNSMAACNSIVCALFWILQRKKWYFQTGEISPIFQNISCREGCPYVQFWSLRSGKCWTSEGCKNMKASKKLQKYEKWAKSCKSKKSEQKVAKV